MMNRIGLMGANPGMRRPFGCGLSSIAFTVPVTGAWSAVET